MKAFFNKYFKYLVLALLIYMPIFGHLNTVPIRIWDEARLAMNAYEMLHNGDLIVTHFEGNPDMWNTKPPMLIWMQVVFMKLFGVNELAVRLPSAFAALFTCIAIMLLALRYLKQFWFGFIAILVLVTTHGYINVHATRTGDYDALLTLFTTVSGLSFFAFVESQKTKYIYLFFVFTAFAVLTKSITGVLFLPALTIYILWRKQLVSTLKNKHFYFGLALFLVMTLGYYLLRELKNPGYLAAVQINELGGRYLNALESHNEGFWFYYNNFINFQLSAWYLLLPFGLLIGLSSKDKKINRLTFFSALLVTTFFLVISTAQTKLEWYDVPMYPFISIIIAVFIFYIFDFFKNWERINRTLKYNVMPFIFLFLIAIAPYQKIINKTYKPKEYPWDVDFYEIGYFLKDAIKGKLDVDGYYLLYDGYKAHNDFYLRMLQDKGIAISFKDWKELENGSRVIAYQNNVKQYVEDNYNYELIKETGKVKKYKINDRKQPEEN